MTSNSKVGAYAYPAQGATAVRPHAVTAAGPYSFTYDAAGNLLTENKIGGDTLALTWDSENKLAQATVNAATYTYTYGADNGRVLKTHKAANGDRHTVYVGGGEVEISSAGVWTKYLGDDVKRVGHNGTTAETFYHHRDHLKGIRVITNAAGAEVSRTTYRPYGDKGKTSGTHAESKWFIGERHDAETGLVFLNARSPDIGKRIDDAMEAIEKFPANEKLKGALPKGYARPALNQVMLGELIDLFSRIGMHDEFDRACDLFGRVYEYCLSSFASTQGKRGGEFLTPRSVVRTLVAMLEPYQGRVYDPCCGTGGIFVQSEKFIREHANRHHEENDRSRHAIAVYGQEINHTTYRLAKMNLAVQGIDADVQWNNEGNFHRDAFPDLKADFILANPPFNIADWGGSRLRDDVRWAFGAPPVGNANFAWLQHIVHHLAPRGTAGVVLANGSMSSQQSGEGAIRKAMIEADVVDAMVALPGQLFYSTSIPACLWILARSKDKNGRRDRRGEILFIDARNIGHMIDRVRKEFSEHDIARIAGVYHRRRAKPETLAAEGLESYVDEPGFCRAAAFDDVREYGHVLTPGRYVGTTSP
ncbi:MAG: N-6 DNA methylase [Hyphomicrobiaceae bacterium]